MMGLACPTSRSASEVAAAVRADQAGHPDLAALASAAAEAGVCLACYRCRSVAAVVAAEAASDVAARVGLSEFAGLEEESDREEAGLGSPGRAEVDRSPCRSRVVEDSHSLEPRQVRQESRVGHLDLGSVADFEIDSVERNRMVEAVEMEVEGRETGSAEVVAAGPGDLAAKTIRTSSALSYSSVSCRVWDIVFDQKEGNMESLRTVLRSQQ